MSIPKKEIVATTGVVSGTNLRYIISAGLYGDEVVQYIGFDRATGSLTHQIPVISNYKAVTRWAEGLATPDEMNRLDMNALHQQIQNLIDEFFNRIDVGKLQADPDVNMLQQELKNFFLGKPVATPELQNAFVYALSRRK